MVATARRAIDSMIGREAPTTDLAARWLARTRELTVGADGYGIKPEAAQAILAKRVEAALQAAPAVEFHLLELMTLDKNLDRGYRDAIRQRLIAPGVELQLVSPEEEAALYKLTRGQPATFPVTRYNDQRGSSWNDPVDVNLPVLAETFLKLRTTLANLRRDQVTARAEGAAIDAATAIVGEQVRAELISTGVWPMLKQRNPIAVLWFNDTAFATWVMPFCTRLASADGLRGWLTTRAQTEKE